MKTTIIGGLTLVVGIWLYFLKSDLKKPVSSEKLNFYPAVTEIHTFRLCLNHYIQENLENENSELMGRNK